MLTGTTNAFALLIQLHIRDEELHRCHFFRVPDAP
jgi:hypothetical protein